MPERMPGRAVIARVFLPFAFGYFLSYLFRVINAVIAPSLAIASLTIAVNLVIDNLPGRRARERGAR